MNFKVRGIACGVIVLLVGILMTSLGCITLVSPYVYPTSPSYYALEKSSAPFMLTLGLMFLVVGGAFIYDARRPVPVRK
jgi:hypothetical protein